MNADPHAAETTAQQKSHWVLVVDDDESMRQVVVETLALQGLRGESAAGGDAALRVLDASESEPLMVITDVLMPGMDGLTLARLLQARLQRSTIVLMSGHLSANSWWPADLREVSFLAKPFNASALQGLAHAARLHYDRAT